jgi:hypothetical protein
MAALAVPRARADRFELDLSGSWQSQKVTNLAYPPSTNWQATTVPGYLSGWQYEKAWYRRVFTLPPSMAGTRMKLRFGGSKFSTQAWLNGAYLGSYLNGYEPFEFDVTGLALPGQTNELIVGVQDWTATFSAPVDFTTLAPYESPRDHAKNTILAPIGGRYDLYGIWQPVTILSTPAVSVADVFVMPSVRNQQLTIRLTLRNDTASTQSVGITNRVLEGATVALACPDEQINLAPGTNQFDITVSWSSPRLWSHGDPFLYFLETTIGSSAGADQVRTRFGFRELWAQGGEFFLNGTPIHLLATATWPSFTLQNSNQIRKTLLDVKAGNNVALRLHTQPWDKPWYEIADEVGMLIVEECAVWCDPWAYRLGDTNFWANYAQHLRGAVARDRNHPSIVLWSLENEILHCGGQKAYSGTEGQLAAMGRIVKALDPTRPITYEADLDPGGEAGAIGLHYPHEFPDFQVWPNAAWWMDQSIARDWVPGGQWKWDRSKPLYIGEFLWVPSTSAADFTILYGDDAYSDPAWYRNQAKALTWRMQIEAYRAYGVNGIGPWTEFEDPAAGSSDLNPAQNQLYQAQKAAYHPNAIFPEEYSTRFFTSQSASRSLRIYNDRFAAGDFTLRWSAGAGPWLSRTFSLPAAGQRRETVSFQVPQAAGAFPLRFELRDAGGVVFTNTIECVAYSPVSVTTPPGLRMALFDPRGTTGSLFSRFGISFSSVTNLRTASYESFDLLVVGRHALTNESIPEVGLDTLTARWQDYARRGGWVLVLEQTNYPAWMPGGIQIQVFDASFVFPSADHPVVQGITASDLRWWSPDHRVVANCLVSPSRGNVRVVAGVGSRKGLESAAALELPLGNGGIVCSQWLLAERFESEPMAGLLLQRLLNYCAPGNARAALRPIALLAETNSPAATRLIEVGLQAENLSGRLTNCNPAIYPVLVVSGGDASWTEALSGLGVLTNFVDHGGKLLLHRPTAGFLTAAQPALFPQLTYSDQDLGLVLRRDSTNAAVRLSSHDLYWIEQSGDWNRPELLSTNVAHRFYRKKFNLASYAIIQAEAMTHSTGSGGSGGWWLYSNGEMTTNITVGTPGAYLFDVYAKGTLVAGVGPRVTLKIDGRARDTVTVSTTQLAYYTLGADLDAGIHQLSLSFDNDAWAPPEDRNLFVDLIRWGRDTNTQSLLLSSPGAVAQVTRGSGLVILNEIAWDAETNNRVKASRHISYLLTGLGASMLVTPGLSVPSPGMRNVNVAAYSVSGDTAYLNSGGRIESTIRFTSTGSYTFDIIAGGTPAQGILPQIALVVDGVNRTNFFLSTTAMQRYSVALNISAGLHNIGLAFLNDFYAPPEDRNAAFGTLTINPPSPPRIAALNADPVRQSATVLWEASPGKSYEVQTAANLSPPSWQPTLTNVSAGTISSWQDTGGVTRPPPMSAAAPERYYRVRQNSP